MIPCPSCGEQFTPYRATTRACSRRCYNRLPDRVAASKAFLQRPDVKARKNAVRRVGSNPARRSVNRQQNLRRYGITEADYAHLLVEQNGCCAICGDPPDPDGVRAAGRLHIDHDHDTGRVRALLCVRCNPGIGHFRNRPDLLERAASYLRSHNQENE